LAQGSQRIRHSLQIGSPFHLGVTSFTRGSNMCSNAEEATLNALHTPEGKEDALVMTLEYGPYMN